MSLEELDLWQSSEDKKEEIKSLIEEYSRKGVLKVHVGGEDLDLRDYELHWESIQMTSHPIFGEIEDSKPTWGSTHKWYIKKIHGTRRIELRELKEGIKRALKIRAEEL